MGKWTRWAIFILFALPLSLLQFTFDPRTIMTGSEVNRGAVPWGPIPFLAGLGFILSFFISGCTVRIYRGTKPAPDFTGWTGLFVDGVKLAVVGLLWFLPIIIVFAAVCGFLHVSFLSTRATAVPDFTLLPLVLLLLCVVFVLFVIVLFFGILGAVRFARTGSIREGIRFSAILTTIRTIGWLSYIILLIGFVIAMIIYGIITGILSVIPYIGWLSSLSTRSF